MDRLISYGNTEALISVAHMPATIDYLLLTYIFYASITWSIFHAAE